jgi:hypothetical protein
LNANDCEDKTCQNKACTSSGQCTWTPVQLGAAHASCSSTQVCSASQTCVECVGAAQCESRGAGSWTCVSNMCKLTSDSSCTGKEGLPCSPTCTSDRDCPPVTGSGMVKCASNSGGSWCEYSCQNTDGDCPSNMYCGTFICLYK